MSRTPLTPLRRNRDFLLLQWGQLFSTAGTSATQIAYPLLVPALTHSPTKVAIVGFTDAAAVEQARYSTVTLFGPAAEGVRLGRVLPIIGYRTAVTPDRLIGRVAAIMALLALWATLRTSIRRAPSLSDLAPA